MAARTQLECGLIVAFFLTASTWTRCLPVMVARYGGRHTLIASHLVLYAGDTITVRHAGDEPAPDIPEASRASHYS